MHGKHAQYGGILVIGLIATSSGIASPAIAQPDGEKAMLEEVVVTARRREEMLQDVPISITALSGNYIRDNNITYFEEIQYYAPGMRVGQSGSSGQVPIIAIRGQRPTEGLLHLEPAAPFYFNEVVVAPADGANVALFDLENVQVLKGPQGTLFGRNSTGGAVLISSRRPGENFGGYAKLGMGNYDLVETEFGVDLPASERLMFRVAGKTVDRGGYQENLWKDRGGVDEVWDDSSRSLRVSMLADIGDALENFTVINWDDADPIGRKPNIAAVNPASPLGAFIIASAEQGVITDQVALGDPSKVETNLPEHFDEVQVWSISNTTTWELGNLTLKNVFGYRDVEHYETLDVDGTGLALVGTAEGMPNAVVADSFSDEFQLQGDAFEGSLEWIAGLYYYEMEGTNATHTRAPQGININRAEVLNKSAAVFFQGTYNLASDWTITLGARNSWDEREIGVLNELNGNCANTDAEGNSLQGEGCELKNKDDWSAPTWLATTTYQIADATMAYASIASGYRAGGFNLRARTPQALEPFDEENVITYEIGLKSDWMIGSAPVRTNLALYQQDYQDIQRTTAVPDESGTGNLVSITSNAAEATIRGLEFELSVAPLDGLNISLSYAYVDTSYDEYIDTTTIPITGEPTDRSGEEFIWIPQDQVTATLRYTLPLDPSMGDISLQANAYYQSDMTSGNSSPAVPDEVEEAVLYQDSYSVLNYQVDWASAMGSRVDISVYLKNAGDEEYVVGGQAVLSQLGTAIYNWGAPRTYGVNLTYNF